MGKLDKRLAIQIIYPTIKEAEVMNAEYLSP